MTPNDVKNLIAGIYLQAEEDGLVTSSDAAIGATVCQINEQNPTRLDVGFVPYLANGFRDMATMVNFVLNPANPALGGLTPLTANDVRPRRTRWQAMRDLSAARFT